MSLDVLQNIFLILGGLGLFLFGTRVMSDGLEKLAGDKMRIILEKAISNRFKGVGIGALITSISQSSTATTVLVVSFVNSGLMTLSQAIPVIMGANIGSTLTAHMMTFKIDIIAPLIIFIGIIMYLFFKRNKLKNLGFILLGIGLLFFGISVMGAPLKAFAEVDSVQAILTTFENPFLAILAGIIFTSIIQSSAATTGIIIALYLGGMDLPFTTAAHIILGSNVATSFTAVLASLAASRESKRAALAHVLFNSIGCIMFALLLFIFPEILTWIQKTWPDGARQVAMFHTFFNVGTTVLLIAFIPQLTTLVKKLIPEKENENDSVKTLLYLNGNSIRYPDSAILSAHKELCRMANIAEDNLKLALDAFYTKDIDKVEHVFEIEETINYLNYEITSYLMRIRILELSEHDLERVNMMIRIISDLERIGDYAENIAEYVITLDKQETNFSPQVMQDLNLLSETATQTLASAIKIYEEQDRDGLDEVLDLEQKSDFFAKLCMENHIQYLRDEKCDPRSGVIFANMVNDLERCADKAKVIAKSVPVRIVAQEND